MLKRGMYTLAAALISRRRSPRGAGAGADPTGARVPSGHGGTSGGRAGIQAITRSAAGRLPGHRHERRPADFNGTNLARYRAVIFLNTAGNRLNGEQEGALADLMERGGGFVGIGTAAESEPGIGAVRRPDRRAPRPGEPDRADDADPRRRRPRAPVDA